MHQLVVVADEVDLPPPPPAKPGPWLRRLRYNSPLVQVFLTGLVCFCSAGMFNALSGLGGAGQLDHTVADDANTALYACFTVFGVLGVAAHNLLGPRITLLLGALAYPLYDASFLYYNHRPGPASIAFPVAAGAVLGAGAGLLWAAQGAIITAYPAPNRRGTYISLFLCLYNLGGVFGGLFPLSFNYHRGGISGSVNDGTYVAYMAFMLLGAALSLLILPPSAVVRDDGSKVVAAGVVVAAAGAGATSSSSSSPAAEGVEILKLFGDWKMLLVLPAVWDSNFFYTYQFNNVNGVLFTLRTKGLNNVFYWGARLLGSAASGYFLDFAFTSRRKRGVVGIAIAAALSTAVWGGGLANQLRYRDGSWNNELIDFKDGRRYLGPFLLFFSYGLLDAMFQSLIYWIIGALTDDSQVLSRYCGFYNAVQSAGAAVAWQVDRHKVPLVTQLIVNWVLMAVSYPLLALLVFLAVKDEDSSVSSSDEEGAQDDAVCAGQI